MSNSSVRKCEIVQQIQYLPGYPDRWAEMLIAALDNENNIKTWAYILHDKDTKEDGTPKEPHVHIVLEFHESVKYSTAGGYVGVPAQYVQHIRQRIKAGKRWYADIGGALSYLTHRNAPDRYQYSDDDVIAKPGYDWIAIRNKSESKQAESKSLQNLLAGIESGAVRRYNLHQHISMHMYINHKSEIEKAFEYREGSIKNNPNRKIEVIYITGEAGAGKTTIAKQYCDKREWSYCISGSSRDPMQDYAGQDVLILDDLRPEVFPLADLLKLLDNHSASSASARYRDKWLEVKAIIITTVLPIEDFFRGIQNRDEPLHQLKRRCKTMIRLTSSMMEIYTYRTRVQEYQLISSAPNPVAQQYPDADDDTSEDDLRKLCSDLGAEYAPEALPSDYALDDCPFAEQQKLM